MNQEISEKQMRELADILGIKSTTTMHGYLIRLKKYGYINRYPTLPRTITILRKS
jgi:repressor LexA